jgi:adenosylcobinamide-GDP ribazoletransferase
MSEPGAPEAAQPAPRSRPLPLAYLHALSAAFGFLTRLPVPRAQVDAATFARSLVWFPWVGAAIGACQALFAFTVGAHLSPLLCATLLVALSAAITGALHVDGLADLFDGLGGGRGDRERSLAIMRDSRIGSFGALALCLVVIAKVAAIEPLLGRGQWPALVAAPVAARAAAVGLIVAFPYAREQGLGSAFREHARVRHAIAALAFACALVAFVAPGLFIPLAATLVFTTLLGAFVSRRLSGLTGDVYGAAIELSELAFLILA